MSMEEIKKEQQLSAVEAPGPSQTARMVPEVLRPEEEAVFQDSDEDALREIMEEQRQCRPLRLGDILTMQCILCIVTAIIIAAMNLWKPDLTEKVLEVYRTETAKESFLEGNLTQWLERLMGDSHAGMED